MLATTTSPCALRGVHVRYSLLCVAASIYALWSIVGYHYIVSVRFVEYTFIYWSTLSSPSSGYRDRLLCFEEYIVGILLTLSSAFLHRLHTTAEEVLTDESRTYVEGFIVETVTVRSCTFMRLTILLRMRHLQNPIPACSQTNLPWTSWLRIHSMSSL